MSGVDDRELEQLRVAAIAVAEDEDELPPPGGFADVMARARVLAVDDDEAHADDDGIAVHGRDGLEPLIFAARRLAERDV